MKHLLDIASLSPEEIQNILQTARKLKEEWQKGGNQPLLAGKTLGMVFQKPSLRTRVSFEVAMLHLSGQALYISPHEIQLGQRESVPDVARVLSRYVDGIMARVFAHRDIEQLAAYAQVPVINGLSDYNHPCQALADIFTIYEKRPKLAGLKMAYVGDGNNMATSLLFAASKTGMHLSVASPPGYEPDQKVVSQAQNFAAHSGSQISLTNDPSIAVREADVIYTDVWASMGQEEERQKRLAVFPPYQVNASLVAQAQAEVMVMHCLPAHRGEEITDEVADGPHSIIFEQAENRMHAQKAILALLLTEP